MDTRNKIVSEADFSELLREGKWTVLIGFFDPLTSEQTTRIAAAVLEGDKLGIVIEEGPEPLLPIAARCALIAALRDVDAVTTAGDSLVLPKTAKVLNDGAADEARTQDFVRFVIRRQTGELS